MSGIRKAVITLVLLSATSSAVSGCAPETRYRVLSFFFDGVPRPGEGAKPKKVKKRPAEKPAEKKALETGVAMMEEKTPPEAPRPPIENLAKWEEVLKALPKDGVGGADWVKAIKENVIIPRASPNSTARPEPPFTLDTLVPAISPDGKPPLDLDVEMTPPDLPFFKVVFPHSSHTLWLNCSSCHPGIVVKRAGMSEIFAGEYCGACHGKVAFDPMTGCPRCHINLLPAEKETVEVDLARAKENHFLNTPAVLKRGKALYLQACSVCHGEKGNGKGPLATALDPKPRDFTTGKFKFRSTPSSSLPTDFDLFRTITRGVLGTSMPSFSRLSYEDRWALVHFIKTFSQQFTKKQPAKPIHIPDPPPRTPEMLKAGKQLYADAGCNSCHGNKGRNDGPSAPDLKDDWGHLVPPFDFTSGRPPKGGSSPEDFYRAFMTGLQGTPMPDYGDVFEPEQAWAVAYHVLSLGEEKRETGFGIRGDTVFPRKPKEGEINVARFPHWFHRIRFRCSACHPSIFQMKKGATPITMDAIRQGQFCGRCHNGRIAWQVAFDTCVRCHVTQ